MTVRLVAAGFAALVALTGPGRAQELNLAVGAPVTSLDPHYHALSPNYAVADMLFDSLTTFDAKGRLQPRLAESWKPVAEDDWEFKLRPGVKLNKGNDLNAEEVALKLERVKIGRENV